MKLRVFYAVRNFKIKHDAFSKREVFEVYDERDVELFVASNDSFNFIVQKCKENLGIFYGLNILLRFTENLDIQAVTRNGENDFGYNYLVPPKSVKEIEEYLEKSTLLNDLDESSPYYREITWLVNRFREGYMIYIDNQRELK